MLDPSASAFVKYHPVGNNHGERRIPFRATGSEKTTGVFFAPGFAEPWHLKVDALHDKCVEAGHAFVTHGFSGMDGATKIVHDFSLLRWVDDAKIIFRHFAAHFDRILLVGCSGSSNAVHTLMAEKRPNVIGAILIAPGTSLNNHLLRREKHRISLKDKGFFDYPVPAPSGMGIKALRVTQNVLDAATPHQIDRRYPNGIDVSHPVEILHDRQDDITPLEASQQLVPQIRAPGGTKLILTNGAGHFFHRPEDHILIFSRIRSMFASSVAPATA